MNAKPTILIIDDEVQIRRIALTAEEIVALDHILSDGSLVAAVEALSQHKPFFTSVVSEMVLDGLRKKHAPEPNVPESFNVLVRELMGLGLDIKIE
mgnify:CR=1 FL=1